MKKYKALIYGFETDFGLDILNKFKKHFTFSYVINSHKKLSDMNMQKLIVNTENLEYTANRDILKNYDKFFNKHFIKFHRMIVSRGINLKNLHEIKNEFSIYLHFFYNIISKKKINTIILQSLPHQGPDYIIYILAKHFKIKIIMFYQTLFPNKYFIIKDLKDFGKFKLINKNKDKETKKYSFEKIINSEIERYKDMRNALYISNNEKSIRKLKLGHKIKKPIKDFLVKTKVIYRRDYYKEYQKNLSDVTYKKDINKLLKKKFVYFPLHDQPELTTSTLGGIYEDQVYALEKLRNIIDEKLNIIVKDHQYQGYFQRDDLFFQRIKKIRNLYILPTIYPSQDLIKKCYFCSTIVGTSGWEALLKKKKSLIFGSAWYEKIDGCISFDDQLNKKSFNTLLNKKFNKKAFVKSFSNMINNTFEGVIAQHYLYLVGNIDKEKNAENITNQVIKELKNYNL